MAEFFNPKQGYTNEEDLGPSPIVVTQGRALSSSLQPNPIDPLFAGAGGPLGELESSRFSYKTLRYPLDVEDNSRFQYYIKFNVLMNMRSKYTEQLSFGDQDQLKSMKDQQTQFWQNRIETGAGVAAPILKAGSQLKAAATGQTTDASPASGESQNVPAVNISALFKRQTVRTQQSISLYMPDNLNWNFENRWEDANVAEKFGKAGMALSALSTGAAIVGDMAASLPTLSVDEIKKKLESSVAGTSGAAVLGEVIGTAMGDANLGLAVVGFALNPSVEVLYKQPALRTFQFDFTFAPRNRKEAETALTIIQMFKFHSAPELYGGTDLGRYYVPPSEFDIEFVGRDGHLWQLGKILPNCVLTNVTVNYGASGKFSTFEDGTPTNIQLQLNFTETAFITKEHVEKGY